MKTEVKIKVSSMAEATKFKGILEALGEKISDHGAFWADKTCNMLVCDYVTGEWFCESEAFVGDNREEISIAKLVEMLSAPTLKAVLVKDQIQYKTLMRAYDQRGWKWQDGTNAGAANKASWLPCYVGYSDKFTEAPKCYNKEIIEFESLNLPKPDHIGEDGIPLWFEDQIWIVRYHNTNGWVFDPNTGFKLKPYSPVKNSTIRIFSTKNAALEWESAHRRVVLSEDGFALAYGDSYTAVGNVINSGFKLLGKFTLAEVSGVLSSSDTYKAFKHKCNAETWLETQNKKTIHTTEDGEALSTGDSYFHVYGKDGKWELSTTKGSIAPISFVITHPDKHKAFYRHFAAKLWVEAQNETVFTTTDGVDMRDGDTVYFCKRQSYAAELTVHTEKVDKRFIYGGRYFSTLEAANAWLYSQKPVLLKTVDGVDLRDGDYYYCVNLEHFSKKWILNKRQTILGEKHYVITHTDQTKAFKDVEAAEEWAFKQNMPVLLKTVDGVDLRDGDKYFEAYKTSFFCDTQWSLNQFFMDETCKLFTLHSDARVIRTPDTNKAFSTEEAAKSWIAYQNEPVALTSMDGVDLKLGDPYYRAHNSRGIWCVTTCIPQLKDHHRVITKPVSTKAFSNKEAAEKWVKEQNAPKKVRTPIWDWSERFLNGEGVEGSVIGVVDPGWSLSTIMEMSKAERDQIYAAFGIKAMNSMFPKTTKAVVTKVGSQIYSNGEPIGIGMDKEELEKIIKLLKL